MEPGDKGAYYAESHQADIYSIIIQKDYLLFGGGGKISCGKIYLLLILITFKYLGIYYSRWRYYLRDITSTPASSGGDYWWRRK